MADNNRTTEGRGKETTRVKDAHAGHNHKTEGLSEGMKNFYHELSEIFPDIRVTSGKREAGDKFSHHHEGNAIDLGREDHAVYEHLMNTKEGLQLMVRHGVGILDETDPTMMRKTGATGPHFHIGKDSKLVEEAIKRVENFDDIEYKMSYINQNPGYKYEGGAGSNAEEDWTQNGSQYSAFRAVIPEDIMNAFNTELEKEVEKDKIKAEKEAESEARRILKEKQKEEEAKYTNMISILEGLREGDEEMMRREDLTDKYEIQHEEQIDMEVQRTLPTLPSIFNI